MRSGYKYLKVKGVGGINQQRDLADPLLELADARDVYAPNGRVVQRPGFVGIGLTSFGVIASATLTSVTGASTIKEDPIDTFATTTTLSSLPVGSRYYVGFTNVIVAADYAIGLEIDATTWNANNVYAYAEYYNGSSWQPLVMTEFDTDQLLANKHLTTAGGRCVFVWPNDMSQVAVNSVTKYWVRLTLQAINGAAGFDADVTGVTPGTIFTIETTDVGLLGIFAVQFPFRKRYISRFEDRTNTRYDITNSLSLYGPAHTDENRELIDGNVDEDVEPATLAVIPHYNEAYTTTGNFRVIVHSADPKNSDALIAKVEDAEVYVGSGKTYDKSVINQLAAWPEAKYITFFRGEMWAANMRGQPYEVRWSAPEPTYRVWPTLNVELLMENDNSPISGLYGYGEHMTLFKSDSIWKMIDTGTSDAGLQTYSPIRVSNGIGCVSNSSVQEIRNRLVFLAEDGVYAYNGTAQVEKISDRIQSYIDRITPGRRPYSVAANWKRKSLYLLAVSLDGSETNNYVLVFDYKNNSWWVWSNFDVKFWMVDETSSDDESVYFADKRGRVFELGKGDHDHGTAISSYITTHPITGGNNSFLLRSAEMTCRNTTRSATLEVASDDAPWGDSNNTSATFDFTDSSEKEYGSAVADSVAEYNVDKYTSPRDRTVRVGYMTGGESISCKVAHSTKNVPFEMKDLTLGFTVRGRRR